MNTEAGAKPLKLQMQQPESSLLNETNTQTNTKLLTLQIQQPESVNSECVQHHKEQINIQIDTKPLAVQIKQPESENADRLPHYQVPINTQAETKSLTPQIQQPASENLECVQHYKEQINTHNDVSLNYTDTQIATESLTPQIQQPESENPEFVQHNKEPNHAHNEALIDTQMATKSLTPEIQQPGLENPECVQHRTEHTNKHNEVLLNYRPLPLKWPVLGSLLIFICVLLALLESLRHTRSLKPPGISLNPPVSQLLTNPLKSHVQPTVRAIPPANTRQEMVLQKRLPVPVQSVTPRHYEIANGTTLPSINRTGLPVNNTEHPTPSPCSVSLSTGVLNRRCDDVSQHPPPSGYPNAVRGPMVYLKYVCDLYNTSPGHYPFQKRSGGTCDYDLYYSDEPSDCQVQLYEIGPALTYQKHQAFEGQGDGGWCMDFGRGCYITYTQENQCFIECASKGYPLPLDANVLPQFSTQVFQAVDSTTSTTRIEGFVTVVTSITTGTDGRLTTSVETTSIGSSVSIFATSGTILITAVRSSGGPFWTAVTTSTLDFFRPGITNQPTTITLRNQLGIPTATVTEFLETLSNLDGITNHPTTMTLRNQLGVPTETVTEYLETLVGPDGSPTATLVVSLETLTDPKGYPTKTVVEFSATGSTVPTNFPNVTSANEDYAPVTKSRYFAGSFLPVLLSVLLSIIIQLVDKNLKFMLPFYALTRQKGALAPDSLCMIPGGLIHLPRSFGLLYRFGEPLSFLSDLLVILSAFLVSLSSEAIGLKLYGKLDLDHPDMEGYYLDLVMVNGPSQIIAALLVLMVVIVALIWIFLYRVKSGVAENPWTIANCASLLSGELGDALRSVRPRAKDRYIDNSQIIKQLEGKSFGLRHYSGRHGQLGYGIVVIEDSDSADSDKSLPEAERPSSTPSRVPCKRSRIAQYFERQFLWDHGVRGILLAMLCGLLSLILYYEIRQMTLEDPFENFMDSQKFGVRFFFVALGVVITLFWDSYFSRTTMMQPYRYLSRSHSQTKKVISSSPATSVFIALWRAVLQRDPFAFAIAFAGILSKFTPILLSNIPFRSTQTWETHVVCAWFTVSILAFMILVLLWSFFTKWPYMPVDPSTIAGNMYYLCDSPILGDFKGRSVMDKKERDAQMKRIQTKYRFGKIAGLSGELGIRVNSSKAEEP